MLFLWFWWDVYVVNARSREAHPFARQVMYTQYGWIASAVRSWYLASISSSMLEELYDDINLQNIDPGRLASACRVRRCNLPVRECIGRRLNAAHVFDTLREGLWVQDCVRIWSCTADSRSCGSQNGESRVEKFGGFPLREGNSPLEDEHLLGSNPEMSTLTWRFGCAPPGGLVTQSARFRKVLRPIHERRIWILEGLTQEDSYT